MSPPPSLDPREIDVVIQGAIAGNPGDPARLQLTARCLESLRAHLPGARLILSTWEGSDVTGLDFDELVLSKDPGGLVGVGKSGREMIFNLNRQLVSTQAGLAAAERPYAFKFRTDITLENANFLTYWERHPKRCDDWKVLQERVLISAYFTTNPCRFGRQAFNLSDWATFGRQEDVQRVWSAPPFADEDMRFYQRHPELDNPEYPAPYRYTAEQHIWLHLLRSHAPVPCEHQWDFGPHNAPIHHLALANNAVVLEPKRFGLRFHKYGFGLLNKLGMYSYAEWAGLYQQHCDPAADAATRPLLLGAKNALARTIQRRPGLWHFLAKLDYQHTKRSAWLGKRGWW